MHFRKPEVVVREIIFWRPVFWSDCPDVLSCRRNPFRFRQTFQRFLSITDSFSSEGEFSLFRIATSMYKAASTVYEDSNPGYRKALYLYYYAKHLGRIQDYAAVLLYLQASVAILVELGRREGKLAHRVRSFLNSIRGVLERVPTSRDMLDNILKIQALLSGSR
jgi:hypothetical protein